MIKRGQARGYTDNASYKGDFVAQKCAGRVVGKGNAQLFDSVTATAVAQMKHCLISAMHTVVAHHIHTVVAYYIHTAVVAHQTHPAITSMSKFIQRSHDNFTQGSRTLNLHSSRRSKCTPQSHIKHTPSIWRGHRFISNAFTMSQASSLAGLNQNANMSEGFC